MTEVGKGKKRKTESETHHAPLKKQVATDGTKRRVLEHQRRRSSLGSHVLWNIVISWWNIVISLVISVCVYRSRIHVTTLKCSE